MDKEKLNKLKEKQLKHLWEDELCYISYIKAKEPLSWAVFNASGKKVATAETIEGALSAADYLNLTPIERH